MHDTKPRTTLGVFDTETCTFTTYAGRIKHEENILPEYYPSVMSRLRKIVAVINIVTAPLEQCMGWNIKNPSLVTSFDDGAV